MLICIPFSKEKDEIISPALLQEFVTEISP